MASRLYIWPDSSSYKGQYQGAAATLFPEGGGGGGFLPSVFLVLLFCCSVRRAQINSSRRKTNRSGVRHVPRMFLRNSMCCYVLPLFHSRIAHVPHSVWKSGDGTSSYVGRFKDGTFHGQVRTPNCTV